MRCIDLRRKLLPDYALIPAVLWVVGQLSAYYISRLICALLYDGYGEYFDLSLKIDSYIKVYPSWIYIYILAYPFWVISFIWICNEGKEMCCKALTAEMLGKLVCAVIFIAFPSYIARPEISVDGPSTFLLNLIYSIDAPDNLFPSMHCSVSYFAARYVLKCRIIPNWYKATAVVMAILVFCSVVFTKQHLFIDILGGIAVAELCSQLSDRLKLYRLYYRLDLGKYYERKVRNEKDRV